MYFLSFFKADCNELLCDGGLVCDCVRSTAVSLLVDRTCKEGGFSFFSFLLKIISDVREACHPTVVDSRCVLSV